jgi:di/tricarboxylate transporter
LILGATLAAFVWGRLRYDLVALLALLAGVLAGVVPAAEAFAGFGHPAVITVAAVLVLSRGFQHSGLVSLLAGQMLKAGGNLMVQVLVLTGTVALISAFMNNVGALALLLPVAVSASCAFLTPIGHQSNTLVLGPGGYRFGDYWKLGLPLTVVVTATAVPLIMLVWPL